jgi:hypothetical protein
MSGSWKRGGGNPAGVSDVEYRARRLDRKAEIFDEIAASDPLLAIEATEAGLMARVAAERMRRRGESS